MCAPFNKRYDKLNGKLIAIVDRLKKDVCSVASPESRPQPDLTEPERQVLEDYFNLCGEEYHYRKQGYVDRRVWITWLRGMYHWYASDRRIGEFWNEKLHEDSYYGLTCSVIVQGAKPDQAIVPWAPADVARVVR